MMPLPRLRRHPCRPLNIRKDGLVKHEERGTAVSASQTAETTGDDIGFLSAQESLADPLSRIRLIVAEQMEVTKALARLDALEPELTAVADDGQCARRPETGITVCATDFQHLPRPQHHCQVHSGRRIKDLDRDPRTADGFFGSCVRPPAIASDDAELVRRAPGGSGYQSFSARPTLLQQAAYGIRPPAGRAPDSNNPHDTGRTLREAPAAARRPSLPPASCRSPLGPIPGGSIRIPASYCGHRWTEASTFGLVPLDGVFPLSRRLDHAGPLPAPSRDAAIMLEHLAAKPFRLTPPSLEGVRIAAVAYHAGSRGIDGGRCAKSSANDCEAGSFSGAIVTQIDIPLLQLVPIRSFERSSNPRRPDPPSTLRRKPFGLRATQPCRRSRPALRTSAVGLPAGTGFPRAASPSDRSVFCGMSMSCSSPAAFLFRLL